MRLVLRVLGRKVLVGLAGISGLTCALLVTSVAEAKLKTARATRVPPVAYYLASMVRGATAAEATLRCEKDLAKAKRKYPESVSKADFAACHAPVEVRGPYKRTRLRSPNDPYDNVEVFVYKGSDGVWYDKMGDAPCFAAGTLVQTPEGERAIETLRVGEPVTAWDVSHRRAVTTRIDRVKKRVGKKVGTLTFANGVTIDVTPNHPFWVPSLNLWQPAEKLHPRDHVSRLQNGTLEPLELVRVTPFSQSADVYDVTVHTFHDYFAAGVLVHNY